MNLGTLALIGVCLCGPGIIYAQTTPAEREDAREERLKILRASDQIDTIQANSEKLNTDLASLKDQIAKLQDSNESQQREINALKTALQKSEDARAKEREVILDKVGEMIAANKPAPEPRKEPREKETPHSTAPIQDAEHGYYYTVEKGQTLSMIATAYSEKGVKVTVDDIRKANNLGPKDVLKVGQKLFIPKK